MTITRALSRPLSRPLARRLQDSSKNPYSSSFDATLPNIRSRLAAIRASGSGAANISATGDSISEGAQASTQANRWVNEFAERLRASLGYTPSPATRYYTANAIYGTEQWTFSGTAVTPNTIFGIGFRQLTMANGSIATLAFDGTDIDVYFTKANTVAGGTYKIDGGSAVAFSSALPATDGRVLTASVISVSGLSPGAHTIEITATGTCILEGAYVYNGDKTNGVHVWDCSHGGFRAADYALENVWTLNSSHMLIPDAHLRVIALGINDYYQSQTKAQFEDSLRRIVRYCRQTSPRMDVVLVKQQTPVSFANPDDSNFANWRAIVQTVGDEYGIPVWDWQDAIGSFASPGNPYDNGDQIHPNDAGHDALAVFMCDKLLAGVAADPDIYQITPVLAYEADGVNLLTNAALTAWTPILTPVVTDTGATLNGMPVYSLQDNNGSGAEGILDTLPMLLAGRTYRLSIQIKCTDHVVGSGSAAGILQLRTSDNSNQLTALKNLGPASLAVALSSNGSLSTLGIAANGFGCSVRPSPFDADNWIQMSLDFKVGASDITGRQVVLYPCLGTTSHQATVKFAGAKLQLLGVKE